MISSRVELIRIERERRRRGTGSLTSRPPLDALAYDPAAYIRHYLGWSPWTGTPTLPGQQQILDAYTLALKQQHEKHAHDQAAADPAYVYHAAPGASWHPGTVIRNRIRVEAGHTVGKTKLSAGIVSHFIDCFTPSIVYTFAPSFEQINDLLWKEIRVDRNHKEYLPGRVLDTPELKVSANHFAKGRATHNAHGSGTERIQGQHGKYLLFILDEAEGIADYVWEAVDSMTGGGISIVLMLANPRTRTSQFHKQRLLSRVANFRISCLGHPNVQQGREVVPAAVSRDWVDEMTEKHAEPTPAHDVKAFTFSLPWDTQKTIYKPNNEYLFRVLGVAPLGTADNTLIPPGIFEDSLARPVMPQDQHIARLGVDAARYGTDKGTLYTAWNGAIWRSAAFEKQDTINYAVTIKEQAIELARKGATHLSIRVDNGGGFGGGIVDRLKDDIDLARLYTEIQIHEVDFGGKPHDPNAFADLITELYAHAAETLAGMKVVDPPPELEGDLTERLYKWINRRGRDVKKLEDKAAFKKRSNRSPDDGDGLVLALAPEFILAGRVKKTTAAKPRIKTARDIFG